MPMICPAVVAVICLEFGRRGIYGYFMVVSWIYNMAMRSMSQNLNL